MFCFRNVDRRSRLISGPTNFNHISHMGPGVGIQLQKLVDLPQVSIIFNTAILSILHLTKLFLKFYFILQYKQNSSPQEEKNKSGPTGNIIKIISLKMQTSLFSFILMAYIFQTEHKQPFGHVI